MQKDTSRVYGELKINDVPDGWTVNSNNFLDIDPDNNFTIEDVESVFKEDIFQVGHNGYLIDLGFYGNYSDNRSGFFRLYVIKGDFLKGVLMESFISRSKEEIANKIIRYFDLISKNVLGNVDGINFGNNSDNFPYDFHIYSAIENVNSSLTEDEILVFSTASRKSD